MDSESISSCLFYYFSVEMREVGFVKHFEEGWESTTDDCLCGEVSFHDKMASFFVRSLFGTFMVANSV